jgi:gluconate 2-dehydrogenase alpha chain
MVIPLDRLESETLDVVLGVLLPSTSGSGATDAGAGDYVRARLAGPEARWLEKLRPWLRAAAGREQEAVAGWADAANDDPAGELFEQLRNWAWEGLLCDPAHGGNKDEVGWRRFGWAPPAGRTVAWSSDHQRPR